MLVDSNDNIDEEFYELNNGEQISGRRWITIRWIFFL